MLRPLRRALALLFVVLATFVAAHAADDEIVREFRKYYRQLDNTATRVEAVLSLEGSDTVGVVDVLVPLFDGSEPEVVEALVRVLSSFEKEPVQAAVVARIAVEKSEARRVGLLRAIANGGYTAGDPEVLVGCLKDKAWDVRRRTIQALAARADEGAVQAILPATTDAEPAVRGSALEALAALGAQEVVDPAIAALADEVWQVRSSAIGALGKVRAKRSIPALIDRMALEEGRLVVDIGVSLAELTARDFGARVDSWRGFWTTFSDRFEMPTDEQLAKMRERQAENRLLYKPENVSSYHGIETPSRRMIFVIDVSGSMEAEVVERDRFKDGGYPSFQRMEIVKTELMRTIETLESYVEFNVFSYATEVDSWKKELVKANVLNKKSALDYVRKLKAIGGNSQEDLASVGLSGSANLGAGKTNTFGGLMRALGVTDGDRNKARRQEYAVAVDTIFFLSDGRPTVGEFVDPNDIRREVRFVNELRKVVIHTIAIGEFQKEFMRQLAEENGGVFVDLGK